MVTEEEEVQTNTAEEEDQDCEYDFNEEIESVKEAMQAALILDRRAVYEEEPVLQVITYEGRVVVVDFVDDRVILSACCYVSLFERKHNTKIP